MSADAAQAAEILTQLAVPVRLAAFTALAGRGTEGASLAEIAYAVDRPLPEVGDACARLVAAGIVTGTGNGFYRAQPSRLRDAAAAVDRLQPISALLDDYPQLRGNFAHGRLTTFPPTLSDRYSLLGELLARYLALDGLCAEDEINRRLATLTADVAGARRLMVESGWLERDRAGTTYGPGRPLPTVLSVEA
ncbi:DUF2087 domain-containing protein [Actinoplanes sp. NPDC051494]|uniref:DUF2087 domain-containing protein n=1 Tax=Actinoplanes sp. NPDC051494 TaxID=3363907 RepID=UPI0037B71B02